MLLDVFDRIRIISLLERQDRRRLLCQHLGRAGLLIDGDQVAFFDAVKPDHPGGFPSRGARGCFMSHLEVLREAQRDDVRRLLIIEDDCLFTEEFLEHQSAISLELGAAEWGLLWLGHGLAPPSELSERGIVRLEEGIIGSHCIGISDDVIGAIIKEMQQMLDRPPGHPDGGPMHVDGAYSTMVLNPNVCVTRHVCFPSIATQRASRSDIAPLRWWDSTPVIRELAGWYRTVRRSRTA